MNSLLITLILTMSIIITIPLWIDKVLLYTASDSRDKAFVKILMFLTTLFVIQLLYLLT